MTATTTSRPRLNRAAMLLASAAAVLLFAAPKAGAWDVKTDDGFKISRERGFSGYGDVTVSAYTGNSTDVTFPTKVTYNDTEYPVVAIGSNVLSGLAGADDIDITVTIPEGYTSIAGNAFQNCYGLKSINVPGSITKIQYNAFEGCKNLASVTFANGSSNLAFGNKVFGNCTSLNSVTLPARLNDLGAGIFQGCTSLSELSFAADNAAYLMQDGNIYAKSDDGESYELHSYSPASSATSFTIPSEVNGKPVTSIFRLAFQNNSTLQSVTVPSSVTNFKASCFEGCSALKKISIAAENPTFGNSAFVGLAESSMIEVESDTVAAALKPSTHYTAANTTVKVKSNAPEPEATPAASLTVSGTGVKDGYSYYTVKLDSATNLSTMIVNLSFDASQVSKDAQAAGQKAAYAKVKDSHFTLVTADWSEADGKVTAHLLLIPADVKTAVTTDTSSSLLLLALPVKAGVTGDIAMTVSAQCSGRVSGKSTNGTVTVHGTPASNRVTSYDVNADGSIDILDITEAQRFYQMTSAGDDWATAKKADVNADNTVDIQDLIDIFLQIEF